MFAVVTSLVALGALAAFGACASMKPRYPSEPLDAQCLAAVDLDAPMPREVRRCDGDVVLAIGPPDAPIANSDEVARFHSAHAMEWLEIDRRAHLGAGLTGCCPEGTTVNAGTNNVSCMSLMYNTCTLDEGALIARLERDLAATLPEPRRVLVRVERAKPVHPPPRDVEKSWPVHNFNPELAGFSGGACSDDSDCIQAGCGNHCIPWNEPPFIATCEGYSALRDAECGCHEQQCTWLK